MKLAGKYSTGYTPEIFPNQNVMQAMAAQTKNPELKNAFLDFQYPFRHEDLINSEYSPEVKQLILDAATRQNYR
jgi:hypothetical protein